MLLKVEIDVPTGATHYVGNLCDEPTFLKTKERTITSEKGELIEKYLEWYSYQRNDWYYLRTGQLAVAKELPTVE